MALREEDYLRIPKTKLVIARSQNYNWLDWYGSHIALGEDNLWMPTPDQFMSHYKNTIDAYLGKSKLKTAEGEILPRDEVEEPYKKLTLDCWIWLNARFLESNAEDALNVELERRVNVKGKKKEISFTLESLQRHVGEGYVSLSEFNSQGMPIVRNSLQEFDPVENIFFLEPFHDSVARFLAYSVRAYLICDRIPLSSNSGLGVRPVRVTPNLG